MGCEPKPIQKPHPPILIGGHGEKYLLRAAAKYADICNIGFELSLEGYKEKLRILEEHCREVGRDPLEIELSHNTRVFIAEDSAELERTLELFARRTGLSPGEYRASLVNSLVGTPEMCVKKLEGYLKIGITYFFLLFPNPIDHGALRLFTKEVMSSF